MESGISVLLRVVFLAFSDAKSYHGGGRVLGYNDKGMLDRYRRPKLAGEAIREEIKKQQRSNKKSTQ